MRRAGAVKALALGLSAGSLCLLAPAGAAPRGCGDVSEGRLCVVGPVGHDGRFTTRYVQRPGLRDVPVRLGYQRKDARLTAYAGWFGTRWTRGGRAELTGRIATAPDECVRGVLLDRHGHVHVTGWRCAAGAPR